MEYWRIKTKSITKYNSVNRNEHGEYIKNEWTSYSDIGKKFDGVIFTKEEYIKIENLYINAIRLLYEELTIDLIEVLNLKRIHSNNIITDKNLLKIYNTVEVGNHDIKLLSELVKLNLREYIHCDILIDKETNTIVRFGYDYYMYVNSDFNLDNVFDQINKMGLFVE